MGIGIKFVINLILIGAIVLVLAVLFWLVMKMLKAAIIWIAPMIGRDGQEILSTMRGWLPKWPRRKKRKVKKETEDEI